MAGFAWLDGLRRAYGDALEAVGYGPIECPYRQVGAGAGWRLRDYGDAAGWGPVLIVAAPIKRPYIWDLTPATSAIRHCLQRRLHVYLLEWLPAAGRDASEDLDDCVRAIADGVAITSDRTGGARPFLMGHSLGGTLAAIFGAWAPERIRGVVLLGVPLCFQSGTSAFRDAITAFTPALSEVTEPLPGSLVSVVSVAADPRTFIWSRLLDAALSSSDPDACSLHARVERWALDEVPLPGRLISQILEWLYREDRFCRGSLEIGGVVIGPSRLSTPVLVVINKADEIVTPASVGRFVEEMPVRDVRVLEYPGEVGVGLQHLAVLIGRQAHRRLWPEVTSWMESLAERPQ